MNKGLKEWMRKDRRLFKNKRGVKLHHGKSKCKEQGKQRKAPELTQSDLSKFFTEVRHLVEEDQGQEANHSVPDLPAQPTQESVNLKVQETLRGNHT